MTTVRDRLWLWGHQEGSHNATFRLPAPSRMTPAEAAYYLGIPNLLMVGFGGKPEPPFTQYARSLAPLTQVVWSIIGDSSSVRNDQHSDLEAVLALAAETSNVSGVIMDDFFCPPTPDGPIGRRSVEELRGFHDRLHAGASPLDLWVVLYQHDLARPVAPYLAECDVITLWTWEPAELDNLAQTLAHLEALAPTKRMVLGCYLWDYHAETEIPLARMQRQCERGLEWLEAGRIGGLIFLASCICDLGLTTVDWTRQWIAQVGERPLPEMTPTPR
jgi:hypothetical protein